MTIKITIADEKQRDRTEKILAFTIGLPLCLIGMVYTVLVVWVAITGDTNVFSFLYFIEPTVRTFLKIGLITVVILLPILLVLRWWLKKKGIYLDSE